jgi:tRNA pseudouridine38-40 synthase
VRAYRIAYDGRPFHGFQRQPDVPTVEDALFDALEALGVLDPDDAGGGSGIRPTPPGYAAAGRTDAGVSALAQTVAFEAPEWLTPRAFSAELPDAVRAWAHADVPAGEPVDESAAGNAAAPADFHATHDAASRRYVYHLHAPAADRELAAEALSRLEGEHDFAALTPDDSGTVRTLETDVASDGPFLALSVEAGGFPRHLVRRIAALVELVATGERPPAFVDRLLDGSTVPEHDGVPTAPAEPLVLVDVDYPDLTFDVDEAAAEAARAAIGDRRVAAASRARVLRDLETGLGE